MRMYIYTIYKCFYLPLNECTDDNVSTSHTFILKYIKLYFYPQFLSHNYFKNFNSLIRSVKTMSVFPHKLKTHIESLHLGQP